MQIFSTHQATADIRILERIWENKQNLKTISQNIKTQGIEKEDFSQLVFPAQEMYTFNQKLNYDDPSDTRTFSQVYFIDSSAVTKSPEAAPVLLFICGEGACGGAKRLLPFAARLGAHLVAIEHRYYGKSLPFLHLSTENLKYLSTENALKDLANIQTYLMKTKNLKGKWIAIGGSYAGSLAAYYRELYPQLVVGALSSSGPVRAKENFEEYDLHVSKVAGSECGEKMKWVSDQAEAAINNPELFQQFKKKFGAEEYIDPIDFLYYIADTGAFAIQYGFRDTFCSSLTKTNDPITAYGNFAKNVVLMTGMGPTDGSFQGAMKEDVTPGQSIGMRQWFYQSCTEYGYWQVAYHDSSITVRSTKIDLAYHQDGCKRIFGLDMAGNENFVNQKFYWPLLEASTSNILYTNGSQDPWSNLSITPDNKNNTNPNTQSFVIEGAAHCDDLSPYSTTNVAKANDLFIQLARRWLE